MQKHCNINQIRAKNLAASKPKQIFFNAFVYLAHTDNKKNNFKLWK